MNRMFFCVASHARCWILHTIREVNKPRDCHVVLWLGVAGIDIKKIYPLAVPSTWIDSSMHNCAGPLEATMANMTREVAAKTEATRALQREWVDLQKELLSLTDGNADLDQQLQRDQSVLAVKQQRQRRLDNQ